MRGALCLNDVNNGKYQHFMEITDFLILTIIILSTENRKKKVIGKEHHGMCKNKILHSFSSLQIQVKGGQQIYQQNNL